MKTNRLLVTEGIWFNMILHGKKKFDFRKGFRNITIGDRITIVEADSRGNPTGREYDVIVNLVIHSRDFPSHFGWTGGEFTIFQFDKEREKQ